MDGALQNNSFTGYAYRTITVKEIMQSVYADGFRRFGWIAEGSGEVEGKLSGQRILWS